MANRKKGKNSVTTPNVDEDGFELVGGGVGKEMAVGEVVTGVYGGVVREMKGRKKGTTVPFYQVGDRPLLGSTVLRSRIEEATKAGKLKVGDLVRVTRVADAAAKKGMAPAKIHELRVKRN